MIEFTCPHCGRQMRVRDSAAGQSGNCKTCGNSVTVPSPSARMMPASNTAKPAQAAIPVSSNRAHAASPFPPAHLAPVAPASVRYPSQACRSFGIAAVILGVTALFLCVPLAIPKLNVAVGGSMVFAVALAASWVALSGLGLLLGCIGLISGLRRPGSALRASIAGSLICAIALFGPIIVVAISAFRTVADLREGADAPKMPGRFNANDMQETVRWAGQLIAPLNATQELSNEIVRNDTITAATAKIAAQTEPLVGNPVSWVMGCSVSEKYVLLWGSFDREGRMAGDSAAPVIKLLDAWPTQPFDDRPDTRYFELRIPEQIHREDAAKLGEWVTVAGTISKFEVGEYRYGRQFTIFVYLDEVRLTPTN